MLRELLKTHNIPQAALGRAVIQRSGKPLSPPAVNRLLAGEYPRATPQALVKGQIMEFLLDANVPAGEIEAALGAGATAPGPDRNEESSEEAKNMLPQSQTLNKQARRHFGLARDPFPDFPALDGLHKPDSFADCLEAFAEAADREAPAMRAIVGESGSGKSTLKRYAKDRLASEFETVELLVTTMAEAEGKGGKLLKSRDIHAAIIRHFKGPDASVPSDGNRLQVTTQQLIANESRPVLLIIDEAHDMNGHTLAHLKRLRELVDGRLGVVLFGQPRLADKLNPKLSPEIKEAGQRLRVEWLMPLDADAIRLWREGGSKPGAAFAELAGFLGSRLATAGKTYNDVFEPGTDLAFAEKLSRQAERGVIVETYPLAVGNLAAAALNYAARLGRTTVDADTVRLAARGV